MYRRRFRAAAAATPCRRAYETASASYGFGLAHNHPFVDGNKRIALIAAETFLLDNGYELECDNLAIYEAMMKLAAGETSESDFAAWLRSNMTAGRA